MGKDFKDVLGRVVAPHTGVDRCPLVIGRPRLAHARVREDTVATVEPTIRAPHEGIQRFMRILVVPTVQENLWWARRFVLPLLDWNVKQIRCSTDPDAAEADFQTTDEIEPFHEYCALGEMAVAFLVLENQDAVLGILVGAPNRIAIRLRHPEPA